MQGAVPGVHYRYSSEQNSRPTRQNRTIPHPKMNDYYLYSCRPWSASRSEIENLNNAISRTYG